MAASFSLVSLLTIVFASPEGKLPTRSLSPAYFFLERFPWLMFLVDLGRAKAIRVASRRQSRLRRYPGMCVKGSFPGSMAAGCRPGHCHSRDKSGGRQRLRWAAGESCLSSKPVPRQ